MTYHHKYYRDIILKVHGFNYEHKF